MPISPIVLLGLNQEEGSPPVCGGLNPASGEPETLVDQGVSSLKGNCPTKTGMHIRQLFGSIRYQGNTTKQKGMDGIWLGESCDTRAFSQTVAFQ